MPKHIRDLSCSVSSFKYQLDKYLGTIPETPCIANYDVKPYCLHLSLNFKCHDSHSSNLGHMFVTSFLLTTNRRHLF